MKNCIARMTEIGRFDDIAVISLSGSVFQIDNNKRQVKGVHEDCNNKKCDNCDLCYMQGTTGEHIEAIESAIQSLESHKRIIKRLKKELKLAENVEERAVRENPLQFDRIKGYVVGIYNALEFVKNDGKEE